MDSEGGERLQLALDQNFPTPILDCLRDFIIEVELIPVRLLDDRLPDLDDRQLLIGLYQLGIPALVTNNYKILKTPWEFAPLLRTKGTVFAIEGLGDDAIRAAGALLLDLPGALKRMDQSRGQVFWLRPRNPRAQDPWEILRRIADHQGVGVSELYESVKVSDEELTKPVL